MAQFFTLSLFVWVAGVAMWIFCPPKYPKASEIGRVMFAVGLLAWLLQVGGYKL
jgi:hypothetical protein